MQRVILAGAGHAHAQVLQAWSQEPLAGVDLVVVSPQALAPYSGIPGNVTRTAGAAWRPARTASC